MIKTWIIEMLQALVAGILVGTSISLVLITNNIIKALEQIVENTR